jgi:hypothetical protein
LDGIITSLSFSSGKKTGGPFGKSLGGWKLSQEFPLTLAIDAEVYRIYDAIADRTIPQGPNLPNDQEFVNELKLIGQSVAYGESAVEAVAALQALIEHLAVKKDSLFDVTQSTMLYNIPLFSIMNDRCSYLMNHSDQ